MELRNRRGGITPAEGCMFAAVGLFVILLIAILLIAYMRFRNPPPSTGPVRPPPAAIMLPTETAVGLPAAEMRFAADTPTSAPA